MFNFKNNNFIIILLLLLVIVSCLCYISMQKNLEGFTNSSFSSKLTLLGIQGRYNYWTLDLTKKYNLVTEPSTSNYESSDISYSRLNNDGWSNDTRKSRHETLLMTDISDVYYYKYLDNSNIKLYRNVKNPSTNFFIFKELDDTADICGTSNFVFREFSNNIYDICDNILSNVSIAIRDPGTSNNTYNIVSFGKIQGITEAIEAGAAADTSPTYLSVSGGLTGSVADLFGNYFSPFALSSLQNPYFPKSGLELYGAGGNGYYNSFEAAMSNPSNPLVNPVNSMNPKEYSQTLFGPNTTDMMQKNSCLNCNQNGSKQSKTNESNYTDTDTYMGTNKNGNIDMNSETIKNNNITKNTRIQQVPEFKAPANLDLVSNQNDDSLPRPVLTDFSKFGI